MSYKVVIVEDEMLIRKQLKAILRKLNYEVLKSFANADSFLDCLPSLSPDIILFDINIRGSKNGIELAQIVRDKYSFPFIFITSYADRETIEAAKITRPNGYVIKPFDERDIMTIMEIALYNAQSIQESTQLNKERIEKKHKVSLTEREYVTLSDLSHGLTNSQIAAKQFVSINTVKTHLKNLYSKFEVGDRINLIKRVL
ncbi:MAG: DNA-binding NarL/FixJ family response regulator [Saprospiraceae bacterium]|jgi:DNA-binding NarL/FixJ family response regulator